MFTLMNLIYPMGKDHSLFTYNLMKELDLKLVLIISFPASPPPPFGTLSVVRGRKTTPTFTRTMTLTRITRERKRLEFSGVFQQSKRDELRRRISFFKTQDLSKFFKLSCRS